MSCKVNHLARVENRSVKITNIEEDEAVLTLIEPYKNSLDDEMNEVIGELASSLQKGRPEGSLGDWFADILAVQASIYLNEPIDLGIMNSGGIRISSLEKGAVTRRKIFELMPFENGLTVLYLKGKDLEKYIQFTAFRGGWPISKGLNYDLDGKKAKNIRLKGKKIMENDTYSVAISDYLANGGDTSGLRYVDRKDTGESVRGAIFDYFEDHKGTTIDYKFQKRIKTEEHE